MCLRWQQQTHGGSADGATAVAAVAFPCGGGKQRPVTSDGDGRCTASIQHSIHSVHAQPGRPDPTAPHRPAGDSDLGWLMRCQMPVTSHSALSAQRSALSQRAAPAANDGQHGRNTRPLLVAGAPTPPWFRPLRAC
jgi:hypothetical protein